MEETQSPVIKGAALGTTALGRLEMRVPEDDGYEEVTVERRWPEMSSARDWCERIVRRAAAGTTVLEIQVFEETWRHAKSWETTKSRPVAEVLQLGVVNEAGCVRWSEPRAMVPRPGQRHPL
jgi:hypothetical protein